jgi:hypothetical protein
MLLGPDAFLSEFVSWSVFQNLMMPGVRSPPYIDVIMTGRKDLDCLPAATHDWIALRQQARAAATVCQGRGHRTYSARLSRSQVRVKRAMTSESRGLRPALSVATFNECVTIRSQFAKLGPPTRHSLRLTRMFPSPSPGGRGRCCRLRDLQVTVDSVTVHSSTFKESGHTRLGQASQASRLAPAAGRKFKSLEVGGPTLTIITL